MPSQWFSVVVDCEDPATLADFWCRALDYRTLYQSDDIVAIGRHPKSFPGIEFVRAERHVRRKSPIHMDLTPDDQDAEVARLISLGARRVEVGQPPDASWVVLADPEDNAFCVLARPKTLADGPS